MLKRKYRLSFRSKPIFKNALNTPFFIVKYQANDQALTRFGFVVSKKIDKRAHVRNSIKRTFRSAAEESIGVLKRGMDFLFILKPKVKEMQKTQVQEEIIKALRSKKLI